jgi:cytoskeletal protein RodZ
MKELEIEQVEQLKQIGSMLREERERLRIPLEEVAVKTYIPLRLLQALEVGQVDRLPEPVFIQGFMRRYADAIGLDGPAIAKTFEFDPSPTPSPILSSTVPPAPVIAEPTLAPATPEPSWTPLERPQPERSPAKAYLPYVLGGVALLLSGIAAANLLNRSQSAPTAQQPNATRAIVNPPVAEKSPEKPPASASPAPDKSASQPTPKPATPKAAAPSPKPSVATSPVASPTIAPTPAASPTPKPASTQSEPAAAKGPIAVAVDIKEEAWIWVDVDGQTVFEGTLNPGDKRTWTAKESLTLGSGNAGGVVYSYNRDKAKPLGERGLQGEVTFPSQPAAESGAAAE